MQLRQPVGNGSYLGVKPSTRFPIYTRGNAGEVFPEVQYPLSFTLSWPVMSKAFSDSVVSTGLILREEVDNDPSALVGCSRATAI